MQWIRCSVTQNATLAVTLCPVGDQSGATIIPARCGDFSRFDHGTYAPIVAAPRTPAAMNATSLMCAVRFTLSIAAIPRLLELLRIKDSVLDLPPSGTDSPSRCRSRPRACHLQAQGSKRWSRPPARVQTSQEQLRPSWHSHHPSSAGGAIAQSPTTCVHPRVGAPTRTHCIITATSGRAYTTLVRAYRIAARAGRSVAGN